MPAVAAAIAQDREKNLFYINPHQEGYHLPVRCGSHGYPHFRILKK